MYHPIVLWPVHGLQESPSHQVPVPKSSGKHSKVEVGALVKYMWEIKADGREERVDLARSLV